MREIIFRGIRLDTKEFTYGYLWAKNNCSVGTRTLIMNSMGSAYEVDTETVGQFTGFIRNDKIYEGDICDTHTRLGKGVVNLKAACLR